MKIIFETPRGRTWNKGYRVHRLIVVADNVTDTRTDGDMLAVSAGNTTTYIEHASEREAKRTLQAIKASMAEGKEIITIECKPMDSNNN